MKFILTLTFLFAIAFAKCQDTIPAILTYISTARSSVTKKLTGSTVKVIDGYIVRNGVSWTYLSATKKPLPATYEVQSPKRDNSWMLDQVTYLIGMNEVLKSQTAALTEQINALQQQPKITFGFLDSFYKYKVLIPNNYLKNDTLNIP